MDFVRVLEPLSGISTFPQIFSGGECIGGATELQALLEDEEKLGLILQKAQTQTPLTTKLQELVDDGMSQRYEELQLRRPRPEEAHRAMETV